MLNGADPKQWSWGAFAGSVAFGAATVGLGKYFEPEIGAAVKGVREWWQGEGATGAAPRDLANPSNYRVRVDPNKLGSNLGNVDLEYVGPRPTTSGDIEVAPSNSEPVTPQLALPYRPTTNTLAQVRRMPQLQKWQAGEEYVRELYGAGPERHFPVPPGTVAGEEVTGTGGRFVDAPVDTPSGGVVATEVKTYNQWRTVNGVAQQGEVPLSDHLQQQILKDV